MMLTQLKAFFTSAKMARRILSIAEGLLQTEVNLLVPRRLAELTAGDARIDSVLQRIVEAALERTDRRELDLVREAQHERVADAMLAIVTTGQRALRPDHVVLDLVVVHEVVVRQLVPVSSASPPLVKVVRWDPSLPVQPDAFT